MKKQLILQLLSIISMVLGLLALLYYQKLSKKEEQEKEKVLKKAYQKKEIIWFYLGLKFEIIGLILLMFI